MFDRGYKIGVIFNRIEPEILGRMGRCSGPLQARRTNAAFFCALGINQVKFKFAGNNRIQTPCMKTSYDIAENFARIKPKRLIGLGIAHVE